MMVSRLARYSRAEITKTEKRADMIRRRSCSLQLISCFGY
jgi:hypothetical protein